MKRRILFIYFDLGGVVFNWKNSLIQLAKINKKPLEDFLLVFRKYDDSVCRGNISPQDLWNKYKEELALTTDIDNFIDWWTDYFIPYDKVHELINHLSQKYKIGIITNNYQGTFEQMLSKGHVPKISYTTVIQSHKLGLLKPESKIFHHALKKARVSPKELLLIDDSTQNVEKAKLLGWNTILFDEGNLVESIVEINKILNN